ncbi:B12-binding domain-containing radical SAM protein [candidate division WOR-3 bacterium]|uniref:B12-binding domain-containing radical SAM protein n=1 Tax=candidate division WOR-3 bacterium TaxID=2052148 RepID=A0A660SJA6_UNCW3|nr:MAG: B12-binding domain-containing radical SAM protein [candidate division WOR-3 bacterium]
MRILLLYPYYPETFWGFQYALKFISKKASSPPLGLLTVAAMLPRDWELRLIDLNVQRLKAEDLEWADYVFISGMAIQRDSARQVIARCKQIKKPVVAGGPLFTTEYDNFPEVDHFVLGEAEEIMDQLVEDLEKRNLKPFYRASRFPDLTRSPIPRWDLVDQRKYAVMCVQYSRGCPFNCEFCDITVLNGPRPRTKTREQMIAELDALYRWGWRDSVFIVDDNFIGNKRKLKQEVLPAIAEWMRAHRYPFTFSTQLSIDLADDEELMELMVRAGFQTVFVGIETPHEESLYECSKYQNIHRDLLESVKKIQSHGLETQGGFILGFDHDPPTIFDRLIEFIQESRIVAAMVGLLNAPRGSRLYQRLVKENRLIKSTSGDNTDFTLNFIPKMNWKVLLDGYKRVLSTIYSPAQYYDRLKDFLANFSPPRLRPPYLRFHHIKAFLRSIWHLGILGEERFHYWRLFLWSLFKKPFSFPSMLSFAIQGYHFRRIFSKYIRNLTSPFA